MIVDLNSFTRELPVDTRIASKDILLDVPNVKLVSDVAVHGKFAKGAASTELIGKLEGSISIDCDRCLEPVEQPLAIDLDVEFIQAEQFASQTDRELTADDLKADAISGDEIDLAEVVREQILLEIPQQFFCKDDCKGLCPKCGTNLNLLDCNCIETEIDPRWAALKNLN